MNLDTTPIPHCYIAHLKVHADARGDFTKTSDQRNFSKLGIHYEIAEEYFTTSKKNVVRGMHFQIPPHDYFKAVSCVTGSVLDVLLDLREGSPAYKKPFSLELTADDGKVVFIPRGVAHGFLVLSESAKMFYQVSQAYSMEHDTGILWDSIPFKWPCRKPILSDRDKTFSSLNSFSTPFRFNEAGMQT